MPRRLPGVARVLASLFLSLVVAGSGGCGDGGPANPCDGVVCAAIDSCHSPGECDPATHKCSAPVAVDGKACNDDNLCTQVDKCLAGVCVGTMPLDCPAVDQCHVPGNCNPKLGCEAKSADDGTPCEDGNKCTLNDGCQGGFCAGGTMVKCSKAGICHNAGLCDPTTGMCMDGSPVADGKACDCGSCLGGVCGAARVGPTDTSMGATEPVALSAAAGSIYFANHAGGAAGMGSVGWMLKGVGSMPVAVAEMLSSPSAIVTDKDNVYWTDAAGLNKASIVAGMPAVLAPPNGGAFAGVAVDATTVYFTDSASGTLSSVPIAGGNAKVLASGLAKPGALVIDVNNAYFINQGDQTINQVTLGGGMVTLLATGTSPAALAVDAHSVYFTDRSAGTVNQVPIGGGNAAAVASSQPEPVGLTVAAGNLYWTNYNGGKVGTVAKLALPAGAPSTIPGSNEAGPVALTHDDKCIYWVNKDSKEVRKAGQ